MTLDALLQVEADAMVFLSVREKFSDLPTPASDLKVLFDALLSVCDLAVAYDERRAEELCASLLSLSATDDNQLN
jgi:hypothetical protein